MAKYALIIGVESYLCPELSPVQYADLDAEAMGKVLRTHGFNSVTVLTGQQATYAIISSHIRKLDQILAANDEFWFYYSGHGFSKKHQNYLTAFDSLDYDLEGTSLALKDILKTWKMLAHQIRLIMMLDVHHHGLEAVNANLAQNEVFCNLNHDALDDFFRQNYQDNDNSGKQYTRDNTSKNNHTRFFSGFASFVSCQQKETSLRSTILRHSLWTYHLLQALSGQSTECSWEGNVIRASQLQGYLVRALPLSIKQNFTRPLDQKPWLLFDHNNDIPIAKVSAFIHQDQNFIPDKLGLTVEFLNQQTGRIRNLAGFRDGHSEPKEINSWTIGFVQEIGEKNIKQSAEKWYSKIKTIYRCNRKELSFRQDNHEASIIHKDFEINISVSQSQSRPDHYRQKLRLANINDLNTLLDPRFNEAFATVFSSMKLNIFWALDLESFIDSIEENDFLMGRHHLGEHKAKLAIEYPPDLAHIKLSAPGMDCNIAVYPDSINVCFPSAQRPQIFIASLLKINKLLIDNKTKTLLP